MNNINYTVTCPKFIRKYLNVLDRDQQLNMIKEIYSLDFKQNTTIEQQIQEVKIKWLTIAKEKYDKLQNKNIKNNNVLENQQMKNIAIQGINENLQNNNKEQNLQNDNQENEVLKDKNQQGNIIISYEDDQISIHSSETSDDFIRITKNEEQNVEEKGDCVLITKKYKKKYINIAETDNFTIMDDIKDLESYLKNNPGSNILEYNINEQKKQDENVQKNLNTMSKVGNYISSFFKK